LGGSRITGCRCSAGCVLGCVGFSRPVAGEPKQIASSVGGELDVERGLFGALAAALVVIGLNDTLLVLRLKGQRVGVRVEGEGAGDHATPTAKPRTAVKPEGATVPAGMPPRL